MKGTFKGRRHDPLNVPFINAPISGKDVVISIESVIGGVSGIGEGWKMLMESLSVGRGISLPSTGSGAMKMVARVTGGYTMIREQFGMPVGRFEGIKSELGKIAGYTYMMDAARIYTIGAIDSGKKPAVINAVMKYHATEKFREVINSGMDLLGGAAISMGERNLLGRAYMGAPIAITVEGANIMTRTLIMFGQGVIRAHPYAYAEIEALEKGNVSEFDKQFWSHAGFALNNGIRSFMLSLSRGYLSCTHTQGVLARYERKIMRSSAAFALMTDLTLAIHGGGFKQKEMLSARFGDILSWMYLLTATMRRYEAEGRLENDSIYLTWVGEYACAQIQLAYEEIFANFSNGIIGWIFRVPLRWYIRINALGQWPSDASYLKLAEKLTDQIQARARLTDGIYLPDTEEEQLFKIDKALQDVLEVSELKKRIKFAIKKGTLHKASLDALYKNALEVNIISEEEYQRLLNVKHDAEAVIQVDSYTTQSYLKRREDD